jgi:pimeloyl-ACP methyl ester carboxylesterase
MAMVACAVPKQTPAAAATTSPHASTGESLSLTANHPHYTYVLVHGAWAGGWEWKKVGNLLLKDGHTVYRPTLTGQGERVHLASNEVDLNTHIQDIVNVILFEDLHDVVLMGHSYGGMVITGVADRVPDRIKCLVYVDAFLPEDGETVDGLGSRKLQPTTAGFIPPPGGPAPAGKAPPYTVPMSAKIFRTPEVLKNPAARLIPATYIMCVKHGTPLEKAWFYKSFQRARSRGYFTETIDSDHVVNQSHPAQLLPLLENAPVQASVNP